MQNKEINTRIDALEKRLVNLEHVESRKKCADGYHQGKHLIIEDTNRIWVQCSMCYADLSEDRYMKKKE